VIPLDQDQAAGLAFRSFYDTLDMEKQMTVLQTESQTEPLKQLLARSWQVRRAFFPDRIEFVAPSRTCAISVTGDNCDLACGHCGGKYLKQMATLEEALSIGESGPVSFLISGGCSTQGRVPLCENLAAIKELSNRGRLNLHTGLVGREEAELLGELATVVSFDLPGNDATIAAVYGLPFTAAQYLQAYRDLLTYTRVVPHICIGLHGGLIGGEYQLLKNLQGEAVEAISFIVFRPTAGTAFEKASPPPLSDTARLMASARLMFPRVPLYLGCMRPGGRYREELDLLAIQAGVNKIVLPSPAARQKAADLGLEIIMSEECCSL
jgi:lipoyl synthase